ncbi:hypothetical protein [Mesorhizobium sp.]|uniref:hypothetical protein n=1 Tax=Mesorhizobium sp. TaxID=1871066 RepID=UPI00120AFCF8|nr:MULTISPECIES: hypothetical protein [Mesorhizobium]TIQ26379.1 MAG: hypothetical protein E5X54_25590 [Mesorhizobium sp.]
MTDERSRGRPRGTGKNDTVFLTMVADLMVKTPGLTYTTATTRIVRQRTDWDAASPKAAVRRWQVKWKVQGEALLAAAHERAMPKPVARIGRHSRLPDMSEAQAIVTLILDAVRNHDPVHYRSLETTR